MGVWGSVLGGQDPSLIKKKGTLRISMERARHALGHEFLVLVYAIRGLAEIPR